MDEDVPLVDGEKTETIVQAPAADLINWAAEELAARMEWAREKIADLCLEPKPGGAWAGRADLIMTLTDGRKANGRGSPFPAMSMEEATSLLDVAVSSLHAHKAYDELESQKQLSFLRLKAIRQMVLHAVARGRKETTYQFKYKKNKITNRLEVIRKKIREKAYEGVEMSHVSQLLAIENAIQELKGVKQSGKGTINNTLQLIMDGARKRDTEQGPGSLAALARDRTMPELLLDPEATKKLEAALCELEEPPAKQIQATVRDAEPESDTIPPDPTA